MSFEVGDRVEWFESHCSPRCKFSTSVYGIVIEITNGLIHFKSDTGNFYLLQNNYRPFEEFLRKVPNEWDEFLELL